MDTPLLTSNPFQVCTQIEQHCILEHSVRMYQIKSVVIDVSFCCHQELPGGYGRVKPDIVTYGSGVRGSSLRYVILDFAWKEKKREHKFNAMSALVHHCVLISCVWVHFSLYFKASLHAKSFLRISVFIHIEITTNYHNKHLALWLTLKERARGTQKWSITYFIDHWIINFQVCYLVIVWWYCGLNWMQNKTLVSSISIRGDLPE